MLLHFFLIIILFHRNMPRDISFFLFDGTWWGFNYQIKTWWGFDLSLYHPPQSFQQNTRCYYYNKYSAPATGHGHYNMNLTKMKCWIGYNLYPLIFTFSIQYFKFLVIFFNRFFNFYLFSMQSFYLILSIKFRLKIYQNQRKHFIIYPKISQTYYTIYIT